MIAEKPTDLSSLTLDAAIQLDRLEKHKPADRGIIGSFAKRLASPGGASGPADLFCLNENPVGVDILSSVLTNAEGAKLVNIGELEAMLKALVSRVDDVAAGKQVDEQEFGSLKRFCLALHRTLLEVSSPKMETDEWMPAALNASIA
jgi:hypothetical protein